VSISTHLSRRLRVVVALLVLIPTLVLAVGGSEAKAAGWTTIASGWSKGYVPLVGLGGTTGTNPETARIQVTNYATKARRVEMTWFRSCFDKYGTLMEAEGAYNPTIGSGRTHTKTINQPNSAVKCYIGVTGYVDSPVPGKILVKVQATY
jgi:hypothetical protein